MDASDLTALIVQVDVPRSRQVYLHVGAFVRLS